MSSSWAATVLTLFPEMFPGPLGISLPGKALSNGLWSLEVRDIRASGIGTPDRAAELGLSVAAELLELGAREVMSYGLRDER